MNNKYKMLIVEDEGNIRSFLETLLTAEGYQVVLAQDSAQARTMFSSFLPDVVILDLGLPDQDGTEFIRYVRGYATTPIIVLSARGDERDKVEALDLGANDYMTKPFGTAELLARIRSALRASRHSAAEGRLPGGKFLNGQLTIDYDARRVFIGVNEVHLTQTEYNILALLSEHCGKVLTYSQIIKSIWGYADEGSVKKLQVNMANLRKKLGVKPGQQSFVTNELGVGYRMNDWEG